MPLHALPCAQGARSARPVVAPVSYEPLGFKCPKCGTEVVNPKAVHGRDENGDRVWKNIIQGALIRLCADCKENDDGSQRDTDPDEEGQAGRQEGHPRNQGDDAG